jgi:hypothetical protein
MIKECFSRNISKEYFYQKVVKKNVPIDCFKRMVKKVVQQEDVSDASHLRHLANMFLRRDAGGRSPDACRLLAEERSSGVKETSQKNVLIEWCSKKNGVQKT